MLKMTNLLSKTYYRITSNPNQNSEKRQTHELNSSQSIQRHSSIIYNSYLRNVRSKSETNTNDEQFHYTPPPILDPTRISTGLFHSISKYFSFLDS